MSDSQDLRWNHLHLLRYARFVRVKMLLLRILFGALLSFSLLLAAII